MQLDSFSVVPNYAEHIKSYSKLTFNKFSAYADMPYFAGSVTYIVMENTLVKSLNFPYASYTGV